MLDYTILPKRGGREIVMQRNPRRVMRDFERLIKSGPELGIWIKQVHPDSVDAFYVMMIGPKGPYENVLLFFTLEPWVSFTATDNGNGFTYPASPPRVLHITPYSLRLHPNLYRGGMDTSVMNDLGGGAKVCLSMLNTWAGPPWTPMLDFERIFVTILSILDDEPLRNEPSYETGKNVEVAAYSSYVQYACLHETVNKCLVPVLSGSFTLAGNKGKEAIDNRHSKILKIFETEIKEIWRTRGPRYIELMQSLEKANIGKKVATGGYYANTMYIGAPYLFTQPLTALKQYSSLTEKKEEKEEKEKK
jgi:ubiquitin-protein ligase